MASFDRTILPGGVGKITLLVATEGHQGNIRMRARVYSNDSKNKQMTLILKAFVKGNKQGEIPPSSEQRPTDHSPPPGSEKPPLRDAVTPTLMYSVAATGWNKSRQSVHSSAMR